MTGMRLICVQLTSKVQVILKVTMSMEQIHHKFGFNGDDYFLLDVSYHSFCSVSAIDGLLIAAWTAFCETMKGLSIKTKESSEDLMMCFAFF